MPGFDKSTETDTAVLQGISVWLKGLVDLRRARVRMNGIVYLHSIRDSRISKAASRNLNIIPAFCGSETLRDVIFVTSFWDKVNERVGQSRETELVQNHKFWGGLLERDCRMERFRGRDSAISIIMKLVDNPPQVLQIQHELKDKGEIFSETSVRKVYMEELAKLRIKYEQDMEVAFKLKMEAERKRIDSKPRGT